MYVGVTRGEALVYVSSTSSFNGKPCAPSRFISDMELHEESKDEVAVE
jgi:hypothetical protein